MQLRWLHRLASLCAVLAIVASATRARAEGEVNARASSELAGYLDTVGVSVFTPSVGGSVDNPTAGWGLNGRYLVDVVSAASPDIVATASPRWSETRHAGNIGARYKPGTFGVTAGGAASYTPDYLALSANVGLIKELDDKNLTLTGGYGFGRDTIGRTGTPFSIFSRDLTTHVLTAGVSRVVSSSLILGGGLDVILESGDQSKPYRYIPMFAPEVAATMPRGADAILVADSRIVARPIEQLPLERQRFALSGRMGWRTEHTTLRLEQRLYTDTWGLSASTSDLRWFVDMSEHVTIWPHLRFHVQGGVDFWQRAYAARDILEVPTVRTGDRELGPLSNVGGGLGARVTLGEEKKVGLVFTGDGTWTSFTDALYVKNRFSTLVTTTLEVTF